ncbi:uncharacterized protein LOC113360510 [Papaver somniferum]|uniref:uncharacterized protein LOC113360510 n=1 Tax=Papaver somniferum TaxID=3469 RepID=UPI000E6F6D77|nr:uncharacterized protein LOC113360510 [Papaver somniferum]
MSRCFVGQLWYDADFGMEISPSQGFVGNGGVLVTVWDNSQLELLDKRLGINSITCLFRFRSDGFKFVMTNAYSPCNHNMRELFWNNLNEIRDWSSEAWCFVGDVNAVRSDGERSKPDGDVRNMKFLNDFISDQALIDLTLHGRAYTWSNKQNDPLLCRLDRCLLCTAFDSKFRSATQTALVRTISYHNALIIDLSPSIRTQSCFRIENHWLEHPDFVKMVENWSTFGNVRKEEEELRKKIGVLNIIEETSALSTAQLEERTTLLNSLNTVKLTRARMAYQRAKIKGFKYGDKNTQYFHQIASGKRRMNYITKLEVDGADVFNHEAIKKEIHDFYSDLFTDNSPITPSFDNLDFKAIDQVQKAWLEREMEEEKVLKAIKLCGKNKSPGPDGYNLEFYKACWGVLKSDVMAAIKEFCNKGKLD